MLQKNDLFLPFPQWSLFFLLTIISFTQNDIKGMRKLPVILVVRSEIVTTDHYPRIGNILKRLLGSAPSFFSLLHSFPAPGPWWASHHCHSQTRVLCQCQPQGNKRDLPRTLEEKISKPKKASEQTVWGTPGQRYHVVLLKCIWSQDSLLKCILKVQFLAPDPPDPSPRQGSTIYF